MNKLLGVSIAALLAVTPMLANAAGETPTAATTTGAGSEPYLGVAITDGEGAHVASTKYVKGAYNAAIGAVNAVSAAKQNKLMNGSGEGAVAIDSVVKTSIAAGTQEAPTSNTALVTEKAVRDAITNAGGQTAEQVEDAIDAAAGAGLATNNSGKLSVSLTSNGGLVMSDNTDNATVGISTDGTTVGLTAGGALEVKDGSASTGLTTAKLKNGVLQTSVRATTTANIDQDTAYQGNATLVSEKAVATALEALPAATQTLTNKTIDATANTISNIGTGNIAAATLVTSAEGLGADAGETGAATDTELPTAAAVRAAITAATTTAGMATQTGVTKTIAATTIKVPVYVAWGSDDPQVEGTTTTVTAAVTEPTYTTTGS